MYEYEYPRPALTTDSVVFGFDGQGLNILLIERGIEPFKGQWALPGGFMGMNETLEECALRELHEETGVDDIYLEQFRAFSSLNRDPRGRVVTIAFLALVRKSDFNVIGGDDAAKAAWFPINDLPELSFDHAEIVEEARRELQIRIQHGPLVFRLLDHRFSISELQRAMELINGCSYDRRNFYRKAIASRLLKNEGFETHRAAHRPAQLFSLRDDTVKELKDNDAPFPLTF